MHASVLGREDLRFWGDHSVNETTATPMRRNEAEIHQEFRGIMHKPHHYLVISGGGADGAYGAGVLVGWSAIETRPEFTMVTGVSTGALTAPFAFLGETYDDELQLLYTSLDSSSIFLRRSIFSIIRGDSIADNSPLRNMLDDYVTDEMIAKIADEHRKGRVLLIGTTNLDAARPVIWNIGRMAASGDPQAGALIRQVLLASTAIPGVFPPAYIRVQTPDGVTYDEMHVDGGTSAQMFLYPVGTNWADVQQLLNVTGTPTAYVIRNSRIHADYEPVRARLPDIAGRSVSSLIRNQGIGDAFRISTITARDGMQLELTWIPEDAPKDPKNEAFDSEYMSKMFDYGHRRALQGDIWSRSSPGQLPQD